MASAIATSLISTILPPMAAKAMNIIREKVKPIARSMADRAMEMVVDNIERDISNLQTSLLMVEGIVQVAEEKQIHNVCIRNWLRHFVDIGYEARDVLDDFITFSSCVIAAGEASNPVNFISSFMLSYVGGLSSDTSNIPLAILNRLERDIRSVRERFDEKIKNSETFATLRSVVGGGSESVKNRRPEVGPFISKQRDALFLGRGEVKQEIMEKIQHPNDDNDVRVVAIWGMGGIGKTTLAQFIYNDEEEKDDDYPTKNRRWLCVGVNKFSAKEIITKIIGDSSTNDVESLQKKLVEKFRGNRFIIVLDDVWNVDRSEWKIFTDPLTNIGKGGVIILTTRRSEVISATNTLVPNALRPLSHQDSWLIFESCAFINGNSDSRPDLKCIGKKIVEKLNGLPLALEVVGRSLSNELDVSTWKNFLDSKKWMSTNNEDDVMSALRWSYNNLPAHLKQCFTYCALFPKGHVYDKKALVEMWMAHGLIQNIMRGGGKTRLEDVGADYFNKLVYASFLRLVDNEYVMHDMIHDLALLVSNEEFSCGNGSPDQMQKVRHIAINLDDDCSINLSLYTSKRILTLYTISSQQNFEENTRNFDNSILDVFKQLKRIRVLVLSHKEITEIPDCISELRHLRYFDISQTKVKSLPDSLCDLYNLQTLAAPLDTILPRNIVNMANLRHLRANITTYEGISKLTSLQELSSISVCEDGYISELGDLRELRGKLKIRGLENVTRSEDAAKALMHEKSHIDELELVFDVNLGDAAIATNVLDALQCPPNLTSLTIDGYSGYKCPNWMTSGKLDANLQSLGLCNYLRKLYITDCHGLQLLKLDGLMFFKHLVIENCSKLACITPSLQVASTIERISISKCENLTRIDCESLPSLTYLLVLICYEIVFIPHLVSIEKLILHGCRKLKKVTIDPQVLVKLTELHIVGCPLLESIYEEGSTSSSSTSSALPILSNLQDIITDDKRIFTKLFNHELVSIASIEIDGFDGVECFGDIVQNRWNNLNKLVSLVIDNCMDLKSLSPEFHDLPSLKELKICSCRKLESLPAGGLPDSLKMLEIKSCPLLYERCKDESGPDWEKIKHVSDREILLHDSDGDSDNQIDDHSDDNDNQIDDHSHDDQRGHRVTTDSRQDRASSLHPPRRRQRRFLSSSPRLSRNIFRFRASTPIVDRPSTSSKSKSMRKTKRRRRT